MKKNIYSILFTILLSFKCITGFSTTHEVTTAGFTFSPDSISAVVGDTVHFTLSSIHSAREVSFATWTASGSTSNGGFNVPFGGGSTVVTQAQVYYYVCGNHFGMGMKGRIFVTTSTGIHTPGASVQGLEIFPNPASTSVNIRTNLPQGKECTIRIFNILGNCMYLKENSPSSGSITFAGIPSGVYFVEVKSEGLSSRKRLIIE